MEYQKLSMLQKKGDGTSIVLFTALYKQQQIQRKMVEIWRWWFITGKSSKSGKPDTRLKMWQFKYMKFQRIRNTILNVLLKHATQSSATEVEPFNFKAILKSKWTHLSFQVSKTWQVLYKWEELSPGADCKVLVHRGRNYRREKNP